MVRVETRKYADRSAAWKKSCQDRVAKRRKQLKVMVVKYLGGRCVRCGYDKCVAALEAHHLDSSTKAFGIAAKGYTRSWEVVKTEADKCILLCSNCHREVEYLADSQAARQDTVNIPIAGPNPALPAKFALLYY